MVRFTHQVSVKDLPTFLANAERFFPNVEWKVTSEDMTIKTKNLIDAIKRLPINENQTLTFESGYADPFKHVFPTPNFTNVKITEEQRTQYANIVKTLQKYHDSGTEVALFYKINWDVTVDTSIVMAMLNEVMPLHGYLLAPSTKELWIRKKGSNYMMGITNRDGQSTYTNCYTELIFDLDDGFMSQDRDGVVPEEFHQAFKKWVANGRTVIYSPKMRPLWDMCVTHTNSLHVQVDKDTVAKIELPPVHPALSLFEVPETHPARPGSGVMSTMDLKKGTELGHYAGHLYVDGFFAHNPFTFRAPKPQSAAFKEAKHVIDAACRGNITRYFNDYNGVAEKENVRYEISKAFKIGKDYYYTWRFVLKRDVKAGEELCIDYRDEYRNTFMCKHEKLAMHVHEEDGGCWFCYKCRKNGYGAVLHCFACDTFNVCSNCSHEGHIISTPPQRFHVGQVLVVKQVAPNQLQVVGSVNVERKNCKRERE